MRKYALAIALTMIAGGAISDESTAMAADSGHGNLLYRAYCTQCHGMEGDGWGVNAAFIAVQPRDHTERKEMLARTDDDLFKVIKFGGKSINKSILMPNWDANLSDNDIHDLIAYLRTLTAKE